MKKNSLLKVLGICFLLVAFLTWVIPAGSYVNGAFTKGTYSPIGVLDFIRIPLSTLSNYAGFVLLILVIGGLYGVMNKTGAYSKLVDRVCKKFHNKEVRFAILTIVLFAVLSSVTGLSYVLLILVPFFMAVLLGLGFTKLATMMSTIGAILVGNIASTYGFDVCGYLNYYLELDINNNIFTKVIFLIIVVFLLIMFVTRHNMLEKTKIEEKNPSKSKKVEKPEERKDVKVNIPLLDDDDYERKSKKSYVPMICVLAVAVLFLLVACYNWTYGLNFNGFEELYETIVAVEIKDFPILKNIIGNFSPLGYWSVTEITMVTFLVSALIGWLYSLKFSDFVDGFKKGAKEIAPVAFYVAAANIIVAVILGSTSGTSIYYTLSNYVLNMAGDLYNVIVVGGFTVLSGLFINDLPYVANYMMTNIMTVFTNNSVYSLIAFVMQATFGCMMMIVPTSALLIAGLSYLKISFKEWYKYVWKFLLEIGIVCLIVFAIMSIFM